MNKHLVFVYGTLRANQGNHHFLRTASIIAQHSWTTGKLYNVGCGYPAMTLEHGSKVYGELYKVSDEVLVQLDMLEDYQKDNLENGLYDRTVRTVYTNDQVHDAILYFFTMEQVKFLRQIKSGDWVADQSKGHRL
ncbi:gamma-glutamylcyclotransferase [Aquibacillus koreensis]|uniref:Gamma-glutamylcyclotransferase family protein n=1 Tax=Aquibacillus koreensis TaxID=279446 RepID=A0A9X3WNW5_9BACI|nr:gamma-glutamylcyclotransferase family protein [Aquibacillus koreensis]MCT2534206.1 gamma-glutamylcyclotransferase [Aquibacillus koreensis]MDC3420749.1 gamma-glutamylcyclotransferase [Aquibacillus koreensis]